MRENVQPIGCIVISGCNTTFYTVCGTEITQHHNIDVDLPNKHGKGGQSKQRFERLAEEARHNYISKVIEALLRIYSREIPLIVGGPAYMKDKMAERLSSISTAPKIVRIIDIQYDKKQGLYELLGNCEDLVNSLQVAKEKKWILAFMDSVAMGDNLSVYGERNITYCLTSGLIDKLIVHEDMFTDDIQISCQQFGTELILISDFLPQAGQIKMGFGGIVGILRYPIDIPFEVDDSNECDNSEETFEFI